MTLQIFVMRVFICVIFTNPQTQVLGRFVLYQAVANFFNETKQVCDESGLGVAKLETDDAYNQALEVILHTHSGSNPIWIGLVYDRVKDKFYWMDGTPTSRTNWYSNEPDNLLTEQCVAIFKDWNNYASMLTKNCNNKHYHILCGTYDDDISSERFLDVTSSKVASARELWTFTASSNLSCGRMCTNDGFCTHYRIIVTTMECTLYTGRTESGTTTSGALYMKL